MVIIEWHWVVQEPVLKFTGENKPFIIVSENCVKQGGFSCNSGRCLSEENICDPFNGCKDKSDQEFQFCSGM